MVRMAKQKKHMQDDVDINALVQRTADGKADLCY